MKRLFTLLITLTLVLSMILVGCGKADDDGESEPTEKPGEEVTVEPGEAADEGPASPAGQLPIVKEPITLTFFKEGQLTEEDLVNLENNGVLKYITEQTNIKLEFNFLPPADGKQKLILSLASGDYPDGALLDWNTLITFSDVMQYGIKEKILYPLNDLIDKYGFEIKKIFELRPNYRAMITAPDGEIYGLPRFTECYHCMSYPKLWFNYEWMEKLGFEEPQTTDELYEILVAFKTQDPNGNGEADEIPLTGAIDWSCPIEYYLMNSFIYTPAMASSTDPRPFLSWIDGKVTFVADKPEYKMGLEWMNKLYSEGLIDPANFTQNSEGLQQQCRTEVPTVGGYTCDHIGMGIDFNNKEVLKMYHVLPPIEGPTGARYQPYSPPEFSGFHFVMFDTCKYPEAAFRLADFMLSEYMMFVGHYGIEGITWNPPEDPNAKNIDGGPLKCVPVVLPEDAPEEESERLAQNSFWTGFMGDLIERRAMWTPEATEENLENLYEVRLHWETKRTEPYLPEVALPRNLFMDEEEAEEFAELKVNIVNHVQKNTSMFITGARSLDEWDNYVDELKRFGLERYIELYTKAYERYLEHMK